MVDKCVSTTLAPFFCSRYLVKETQSLNLPKLWSKGNLQNNFSEIEVKSITLKETLNRPKPHLLSFPGLSAWPGTQMIKQTKPKEQKSELKIIFLKNKYCIQNEPNNSPSCSVYKYQS